MIFFEIKGPLIGYYGDLAEWVDLALIAALAEQRPEWKFVLVGDVFVTDLAGLDRMPNVHLLELKPYAQMLLYLYRFDVCIIPFGLYNVTHAVDSVKFYEFVCAGKPVVSVLLQEMKIYEQFVYFASEPASFIKQIERAMSETDVGLANERVKPARANDWTQRFENNRKALVSLHPKVSIIVISYNSVELTRRCIESVLCNTTYPNYKLVVIDNASSADTRNYLRYLHRTQPNITIKLNNQNLRFSAANNQGLRLADGAYHLLLNNDTVVPWGWVDPLLRHLQDRQGGLVGPVTNSVGNEAKIEVDSLGLEQMEDFAEKHVS